MNRWIDIHCHLNMLELEPSESLSQATVNGVEKVINIATEPADFDQVIETVKRFYPQVLCAVGVHPHEAKQYNLEFENRLIASLNDPGVVAVGEIGLDFFYDNSPREKQKEIFRRQLEIASHYKKPIEIHTREAEKETVAILKEFKRSFIGVFHCFSGSEWLAKEAMDLGFDISASGIITFPKAEALRNIIKEVPLERLHIETDAPFLAPVPQRGKKNTPAFVVHTARKLSEIKNTPESELSQILWSNARRLFGFEEIG